MGRRVSLQDRKRVSELQGEIDSVALAKKDELLALKLQEMNQSAVNAGTLQLLPLASIRPDPNQPRKVFRQIKQLAQSIREQGFIQPIIVTPKQADGFYQIIAGERRYLASIEVGRHTIPCLIKETDDVQTLLVQILENDQREAVSLFEEAGALSKLVNDFGLSKGKVAKELGREASWVSMRLGLFGASDNLKMLVNDGLIEDIRTLHELRMLERDHPKVAAHLANKIKQNQVSGSYRQAISALRQKIKMKRPSAAKSAAKRVQKLEMIDSKLLVYTVGGKHPIEFELSSKMWVHLKAIAEKISI